MNGNVLFYSCLCLYSTINGKIDEVNHVLELRKEDSGAARYAALDKWTLQLANLHQSVINKIA